MGACIFCKIASGEMRADVIHRDEHVVAFKDINPRAPLHALVIPRAHVESLNDLDDPLLAGRLALVAAKIARDAGYADRGFRVVSNSGADAGQSVPHLHFHVLAGRSLGWPPG